MRLVLQGNVSAAQLDEYDRNIQAVFDEAKQPIYFIADMRQLTRFPTIAECLRMRSLRHPNLGTTVVMGAVQNRLLKFFMSAITMILPISYKDADTFEQAQQYIMAMDPELPPAHEWKQAFA